MRRWRDYTERAPNEVTSVCVSMTFPANPELPASLRPADDPDDFFRLNNDIEPAPRS